jgi:hypothetical protein
MLVRHFPVGQHCQPDHQQNYPSGHETQFHATASLMYKHRLLGAKIKLKHDIKPAISGIEAQGPEMV